MSTSQLLKTLLKSHVDGNDDLFQDVARQIASHEDRLGHGRLAEDLRAIIERPRQQTVRKAVPLNQPKGELADLLDVSYPRLTLSDMVLEQSVVAKLGRTIKEQRHMVQINAHGLSARRKLLLVGAPGTGKTMTAAVMAAELSMPLYRVRLDALISKFLGETASKLRLVFDAMKDHRGVYFFDEFDAIASQRGMANDVGEIRRALNSFLQIIEQDESGSLILAATNHPEILDYAVFRRFDDLVHYELPDAERIKMTLQNRLAGFTPTEIDWNQIASQATGLSYADLVKASEDAIKEAIIFEQPRFSEESLLQLFDERRAMRVFRNQ